METNTTARFDALEFKRKSQERVQDMLGGLSPDEEIRLLADAVRSGAFHSLQAEAGAKERRSDSSMRDEESCVVA